MAKDMKKAGKTGKETMMKFKGGEPTKKAPVREKKEPEAKARKINSRMD